MAIATVPVGRPSRAGAVVPLLVGAVVALGIGVYGKVHDPTGESIFSLVFTKTINMKAWFVTAAVVLALFQLLTALWMYGRLPFLGAQPAHLGVVHRVSGSLAFLLTVPVAYHRLWYWFFTTVGFPQF